MTTGLLRLLLWLKVFMRGVAPAVIGALGVSVVQMAPHAAPDIFTWGLLGGPITIALFSKLGPLPLMAGQRGAWISVLAQNMGLRAGVPHRRGRLSPQASRPASWRQPFFVSRVLSGDSSRSEARPAISEGACSRTPSKVHRCLRRKLFAESPLPK